MDSEVREYINKIVKEVADTYKPSQIRIMSIDFASKNNELISSTDDLINFAAKIENYINGKETKND